MSASRRPPDWALTVVACAAAATMAAAQGGVTTQGARDAVKGPVVAGHGSISGRVVSDQTPASPIAHAMVSVTTVDGQPVAVAYTDAHGQFAASSLAAGRYVIVATRPAFVRAPYGARRNDRTGTPITLADGQQVSNLTIAMARGAVITGTVTDGGQPIPGVLVRVLQYRLMDGERTLVPVGQAGGPTTDTTDDRGMYRLFGLPAGEYVISASPRPLAGGDIRQMTPADIQSVRQAIQAANAAATTPQVRPPDAVTVTYATVYYPGTTVMANAAPLSVAAGEERSGIDLAMQLVRTAHVDGVVVTPPGVPPPSVQMLLVASGTGSGGLMPMSISINRVVPGPDGRFSYTGVAPGQYTITARATVQGGNGADANVGPGRGLAAVPKVPPGVQGPALWGQADVTVNGDNISGVSVTLQPGMTISGRVAVEAAGVSPPDLANARLQLTPASMAGGPMIGVPLPTIDASGHFTMTGVVPGRYRLSASLNTPNANWTAKSAIVKGRDVLDGPLEVAPNDDISNAVVTFTSQTQAVTGHLQDASGRPATDFTIILFPADRALWSSTRRVRTARPGTDGQFIVDGVPAGEYRLAAVVDVAPGETSDPSFLDEVSAASIAVTLHDGEKKVQDVRLTGGG
jgi:carboxypeptidase family protein